jgi:hypothetical protein
LKFYFVAKGELLQAGDDSIYAHWASISEIKDLIKSNSFSDIDKPAIMLFIQDRLQGIYNC